MVPVITSQYVTPTQRFRSRQSFRNAHRLAVVDGADRDLWGLFLFLRARAVALCDGSRIGCQQNLDADLCRVVAKHGALCRGAGDIGVGRRAG